MLEKKLIDVLLDQGKVQKEIALSWKDLSNFEVENKLESEHMVSSEDIARAYAGLYSLPYVTLRDLSIPKETLGLVPEKLAQEYKIIAYKIEPGAALNGNRETVWVAISEPSKLSSHLREALDDLENEKGFKIKLAITTRDDFSAVISQYKTLQPQPVANPVNVETIDLGKITIPLEVISKFPEDIARKYQMVVFESPHPSLIKVAVSDPSDKKVREILDFVKTKNDIAITEYKVTPAEIEAAMRFYKPQPVVPSPPVKQPLPPEADKDKKPSGLSPRAEPEQVSAPAPKVEEKIAPTQESEKIEKEDLKPIPERKPDVTPEVKGPASTQVILPAENDLDALLGEKISETQDFQKVADTGHVPKIIAASIILAVVKKASDIHIEPGEKDVRIRFRIDGLLRDIIKVPLSVHPAIVSRIKILSKLKIDESRIPQDGRFDVVAAGHVIDLRVSTLPTVHGEKIAMRILDKSAHIYTLEELGVTGHSLKILLENMNKPYGIVLSTGPTGSGKTTTLYAILNRISNASVNIITLEDPVEYDMPGINQCQIKPKIGFTFANGLRSILRQDPNIIMVGEIRDSETAGLATQAALTGHLVLSTLHTNDAAGSLPRLIDMGVEPFFITSLINAIIGQRLVRKLCPKCKRQAHIPEPIQKEIEMELVKFNLPKPYQFYEGAGCPECELGYKGRIGIFEVLTMSQALERVILERKPASDIKKEAISGGMVTMKQDGLIKALKGLTTVNEVLRVITV